VADQVAFLLLGFMKQILDQRDDRIAGEDR
jgi:hypothetical protein